MDIKKNRVLLVRPIQESLNLDNLKNFDLKNKREIYQIHLINISTYTNNLQKGDFEYDFIVT